MTLILEVKHISKSFIQPDKSRLSVLDNLSLKVDKGTIIAITGASGCGKSTLLHLLGSLDKPDNGDVLFSGRSILHFSQKEKADYRNKSIGFLYQFHYLMSELNVIENVAFPFLLTDFNKQKSFARAEKILEDVGLKDRTRNMPFQLSGGERQRVAIARSLINSPELLLADEPTGNLDWNTGERVFAVFKKLIKKQDLTAIVVTHNEQLAKLVDKSYRLIHGKLA